MSFAYFTDVEARWRTLTEAERNRATVLAADASDMIRDRWPDIDSRVGSGAVKATSLTRIVANMVKRSMMVGVEGLESRSETVGPFGYSNTFSNPNGNLYFTEEDLRVLESRPKVRMGWLA